MSFTDFAVTLPTDQHAKATRKSSLQKELEALSIKFVQAGNQNSAVTPEVLVRLQTPFKSIPDAGRPFRDDARSHVARTLGSAALDPEWKVDETTASSMVDEDCGRASVIVTSSLKGFYDNITLQRAHQILWKRNKDGTWMMYEHMRLNGNGRWLFAD